MPGGKRGWLEQVWNFDMQFKISERRMHFKSTCGKLWFATPLEIHTLSFSQKMIFFNGYWKNIYNVTMNSQYNIYILLILLYYYFKEKHFFFWCDLKRAFYGMACVSSACLMYLNFYLMFQPSGLHLFNVMLLHAVESTLAEKHLPSTLKLSLWNKMPFCNSLFCWNTDLWSFVCIQLFVIPLCWKVS